MKIYPFIVTLCLVIGLASCGTNKQELAADISTMEDVLAETPAEADVNELVEKYTEYANAFPDEKAWGARYLYRAASIFYRNKELEEVVPLLEKSVAEFEDADATPNSYALLATTYQDLGKPDLSVLQYQKLVEKYPNHPDVFQAYIACKQYLSLAPNSPNIEAVKGVLPTKEAFLTRLKTLEDASVGEAGTGFSKENYPKLSKAYEAFAVLFSDDAEAPNYWHKVGECERVLFNYNKALSAWENAYKMYPESPMASKALFQIAFTYEENLKNNDQAKKYYEEFLEKYPDHELTSSAEFSLQNLGKPIEEIIKEFEKNNKLN